MAIPMIKMAVIGILPSRLKVAFYRLRGARIGKGVKIGLFSVLLADDIEIGDGAKIGALSFVRCRKLRLGNRSKIGSMVAIDTGEVKLGHDSVIMEQVVIGGMQTPRSRIDIGARVKIFPYCFLNPTEPIVIEDEVGGRGGQTIFSRTVPGNPCWMATPWDSGRLRSVKGFGCPGASLFCPMWRSASIAR